MKQFTPPCLPPRSCPWRVSAGAEETLVPATAALARTSRPHSASRSTCGSPRASPRAGWPSPDIDGVIIYELPPDKICLYRPGQGAGARRAGAGRLRQPDGGGDICVPLADVSVRLPPSRVEARRTGARSIRPTGRPAAGCGSRARASACGPSSCKFDTGLWDVVYDEAKDLFALRVDAGEPYPVLRQFRKAGGAAALLPDAQGAGPGAGRCRMRDGARSTDQPAPPGWTAWQVVPTGKRKEAFDCGRAGRSAGTALRRARLPRGLCRLLHGERRDSRTAFSMSISGRTAR